MLGSLASSFADTVGTRDVMNFGRLRRIVVIAWALPSPWFPFGFDSVSFFPSALVLEGFGRSLFLSHR